MVDQTVSTMTVVSFQPELLIPVVDPQAPVGLKNAAIMAGSIPEASPLGFPVETVIGPTDMIAAVIDGENALISFESLVAAIKVALGLGTGSSAPVALNFSTASNLLLLPAVL